MKNTYTLSECKKIYENPAFLEKLKEISDAPAETAKSMYHAVHEIYKDELQKLKGTDADPYGLLYIIEAAENGDDNAVNLALGSTKIAPLEKEGKDGIIDYWGKKAITYRCSTSCATLNCLLHGTNAPEEIKFAAARWGMADSSPLGKLAGVQFLTFAEKYPDSFEGKSAMLTEQTNEVVLQDIFEEGLVQKDYPVCFYIAFLLRERGAILPLPKIFELCKNAEVESFYYLFSGEPMPDRIDRKVCRNECIHMDQYAKQAVRVMHKEIFLRAMFDYSVTYLDTNIEPFAATATHCISDRGAYETQAEDLGVVLQASYHSAKEVDNEELMQNSEQGYRQIVMERLFSGHPMNIPGLKDAVDQERLRRAIYYNKEAPAEGAVKIGASQAKTENVVKKVAPGAGIVIETMPGAVANFSDGCIAVSAARMGGDVKETDDGISFSARFAVGLPFDGESVTISNMQLAGVSAPTGDDAVIPHKRCSIAVLNGILQGGKEEYPFRMRLTIDLPLSKASCFERVRANVERVSKLDEYTIIKLRLTFAPYSKRTK